MYKNITFVVNTNLNMMKTPHFFILFLFLGIFSKAQNKLFPQAFFDKKQAEQMLALGTATIEGVASTRQKGFTLTANDKVNRKQVAPEGTLVTLYPLTPYFEEFIKLRNKKKTAKPLFIFQMKPTNTD